ncbi:MAG: ROK family protein [Alistipes sp.]
MKRYAIGIDLGGTALKFAVVDSCGEVLFNGQHSTSAHEGAEQVISQLLHAIADCGEYASSAALKLEGVGIGTPGVVSADGRTVLGGAENIEGWEQIALAERIEEGCGLRTTVSNCANVMSLGEWMFGAARGDTDVIFVTVGTGIGCGALIDGRLYRGYRNRGMELGHVTIKCDGERCACGGIGCLEHYASTAALIRRFRELTCGESRDAEVDGKDIVFLYGEGHRAAVQAMEEHWHYLGLGIAGMINLFAPQKVVVGGGISEWGDFYLTKLREQVNEQVMAVCGSQTQLVSAELGNRAGCLGAAGLILNPIANLEGSCQTTIGSIHRDVLTETNDAR